MTTLEQIKQAIEKLSLEERGQLAKWFHGWEDDDWDLQMKQDVSSGKLDHLLSKVDEDVRTGRLREHP